MEAETIDAIVVKQEVAARVLSKSQTAICQVRGMEGRMCVCVYVCVCVCVVGWGAMERAVRGERGRRGEKKRCERGVVYE